MLCFPPRLALICDSANPIAYISIDWHASCHSTILAYHAAHEAQELGKFVLWAGQPTLNRPPCRPAAYRLFLSAHLCVSCRLRNLMMRKVLGTMMTCMPSQALLTHQVRPHPQIRRNQTKEVVIQGRDHQGQGSLVALEVLPSLPA